MAGGETSVSFPGSFQRGFYDPTAAEFTATGSMTAARYAPRPRCYQAEKCFIAGGSDDSSAWLTALASASYTNSPDGRRRY